MILKNKDIISFLVNSNKCFCKIIKIFNYLLSLTPESEIVWSSS